MRVPVPGTVPRDITPFNYTIDAESRIRAGKELINPESPDSRSFVKGEDSLFNILCRMSW